MNKISVMVPVYNDVDLIDLALNSVVDFADEIFIVEGCWFPNMSCRSTDGTIEIIENFKSKYPNKTKIIYWDYKPDLFAGGGLSNTNAIGNSIASKNLAINQMKSSWYFMVNADEIYKYEDLVKLNKYLDNFEKLDEPFIFGINAFTFYFGLDFGNYENFYRINKLNKDGKNELLSEDVLKYNGSVNYINLPKEIIFMYHYGYLSKERAKFKLNCYDKEIGNIWINKFNETFDKQNYKDSVNYHLTNSDEYKFSKFNGIHPDCIKERFLERF